MKPVLTDAALTDTGRVREHNEDTIGSDPELGLYVLADGMGGYNAGEVASGLAVKTVLNHVRDGFLNQNVQGIDRLSGLMRPTIVLRDALLRANKIVHLTSKSQPHCEGMGTTVVAAMFFKDRIITVHVGDSRVYRIRNGVFEQITNDHSLLQELVDRGFYTPEEAATSTNKNYVTRALGVESTVEVEVREHPIAPGDLYLLCSDGLSDMLSDAEIKTGLLSGASLAETAQRLVEHANAAGGRDNISVVLARVDRLIEPERSWADRIRGWFR